MNSNKIILPIFILYLLSMVFGNTPVAAQNSNQLKFGKDKTFKIAQFTDVHWDNNSENCVKTLETIRFALNEEKPDLAILTGDLVTDVPAVDGWKTVAKPFIEAEVPWTVTLGNHDAEPGITRDEIFELLQLMPYFVGNKGAELTGCGNYILPVQSSDGNNTAASIYCFDSNSYSINKKQSDYDWIHFDQIAWYREQSQKATAANNNKPLPSLAFFHIPLPEYEDVVGKETTVGEKFEGIASADVNSGLFASMLEMNDVMGVFVGHDHNNNYIGIHKNIALAFGQVTGADAYGKLERGSRIIELNEGEYSFDTWIRTPGGVKFKYNYPAGLTYNDSNLEYSPGTKVSNVISGVLYKYFEGEFESVKDLAQAKVLQKGQLENFDIKQAKKDDYFGFEFEGFIKIGKKGVYRFYSYSDDGSQVFVDDKLVVDNDGSHSARRKDGSIALEAGFHKVKVLYFESYMGNELEIGISGLSIRETKIPANMLFINK
ncbi:metallophosphoesterase [Sunxiuqinia sp. sy24]|uniref:metallophosphoesterase n=1 Tax=Sunxiuqinia sp. sy24 TaxID=3461495 RepID=UPI0040457B2C